MELDVRLDILRGSNQIDDEVYCNLKDIIEMVKNKHDIKLNEENAAMLMTHLSVAIMRIKNKDIVKAVDEDIFEEIRSSEYYALSNEWIKDMEEVIHRSIPENEKGFIVMHLCTLFVNLEYTKL